MKGAQKVSVSDVLQHMGHSLGSELPGSQSKESPISSPIVSVGSINTNQTRTKGPKKHSFS